MAVTYSTVKYGSKGSDVSALQTALNAAGYSLAVDGNFGAQTLAAVKSYQQAKGLSVDGIVGANTWGALTSSAANSGSPTGQSSALQELLSQLQSPSYTPKTNEEIKTQAEGEYQSYYDQLRLAAQQQKDTADLALQQQRDTLQGTYDKQREQSEKAYGDAYSAADRHALSRGMQRSSYNAQTLSNIDLESAEARQALYDQQTAAEGAIDTQRTHLASQLAQQISQYSASQAADVLNRMRALEDQEYERSAASQQYQNSLSQQIYEMIYREQRDSVADQQWQQEFAESTRQFNASLAAKKSSSSKATTPPVTNPPASNTVPLYDAFLAILGGSGTTGTSALGAAAANVPKAVTSATSYNKSKNVAMEK